MASSVSPLLHMTLVNFAVHGPHLGWSNLNQGNEWNHQVPSSYLRHLSLLQIITRCPSRSHRVSYFRLFLARLGHLRFISHLLPCFLVRILPVLLLCLSFCFSSLGCQDGGCGEVEKQRWNGCPTEDGRVEGSFCGN